MDIDHSDLLVLSAIPGVGSTRLRALVTHFGGTAAVLRAGARNLVAVEGIEHKTASSILAFLRSPHLPDTRRKAVAQLSRLRRMNARMVTFWDNDFPCDLKTVYDPPPYLFVLGALPEPGAVSIAIVGTRSPTPYGERLAERFAIELAALGVVVVSGLARGIDTVVHESVVREGGLTIGVIGSGLDRIYPPENRNLAHRMLPNGAIISELSLGSPPDAVNFPKRNRIISGMTAGILVIETGISGGAMITAASALDQNREVFATPSPVVKNRQSGTNTLIKEGRAKLVENVDDILTELHPRLSRHPGGGEQAKPFTGIAIQLSLFEERVFSMLGDEPAHVDAISTGAGLSTAEVLAHLLSLELKGAVRQMPGKYFARR